MAQFDNWCVSVDEQFGNHFRRVMTGQAAQLFAGIQATAAIVPGHYASEEQVARALVRLGKPAAATLIQNKLPTTKAIRSGDLGEIYATEWIDSKSGGYRAPIKRLRWKDHRNMAMRGEDVIGILQDAQTQRLHFLKTEVKSRATLTTQVLTEARAGLDKDGGLPSAHALSFISARLLELGNLPLADAIDDALLNHGIPLQNVRHLLFTFPLQVSLKLSSCCPVHQERYSRKTCVKPWQGNWVSIRSQASMPHSTMTSWWQRGHATHTSKLLAISMAQRHRSSLAISINVMILKSIRLKYDR